MGLLVFGSINLDLSVAVDHAPVAGETVLGRGPRVSPGGKGANQAHAARLYGGDVQLVGRVGADSQAGAALAGLKAAGVDLGGVVHDADRATGVATVMVFPDGDNAIVVAAGANAALHAEDVSEKAVAAAGWLLLQMEVPVAESMAVARRVRAQGGKVLLNLAPAHDVDQVDPGLLDWLVLNRSELAVLCASLGMPSPEPAAGAAAVARAWNCTTVVTLGAEGLVACAPGRPPLRVAAPPTEAHDTTGAGDTFCGVLAAALLEGDEPRDALRTACVAASLACGRPGAQTAQPSRTEIDDALARC